jgi:hypothetical protein
MAGQTGTTSSALAFGGYTGTVYVKTTEDWNGASWVEVADMSASGGFGAGGVGADNTSALAFGGAHPTSTDATEQWTGSTNLTKTIDTD